MKTAKLFGLLALAIGLTAAGCEKAASTGAPAGGDKKAAGKGDAHKDKDDDHDHGPGPHGGTVIELGKYHGEFVVDHKKKEATIYILAGNVKTPVPLKAEKVELSIKKPMFQVEMKAAPLDGEKDGASSRFVATHDNFGVEQEFEGAVIIKAGKDVFDGDFKETAHDHGKEKK
ncbi:MAG TPA: hypothetical protein VM597_38975 [Gemmataceae bacterium]|jgi:hypothetical protein|nr:hypothetical protein [Gemmataceae bacterium]